MGNRCNHQTVGGQVDFVSGHALLYTSCLLMALLALLHGLTSGMLPLARTECNSIIDGLNLETSLLPCDTLQQLLPILLTLECRSPLLFRLLILFIRVKP